MDNKEKRKEVASANPLKQGSQTVNRIIMVSKSFKSMELTFAPNATLHLHVEE